MEDNTSSKVSKNISKNEEKNRIFKAAVGTEIIKIATENSFFLHKIIKKVKFSSEYVWFKYKTK